VKNTNGVCRLCGKTGKLSYEHTPPAKAFNNQRVLEMNVKGLLFGKTPLSTLLKDPKGETNQRGAGGFTLCEQCNTTTGSWYGAQYVEFVKQAMPYTSKVPLGMGGALNFKIAPLNVLKQFATMFLSANSPRFNKIHTELVRFVQNSEENYLPRRYKFLLALRYDGGPTISRQSGVTGRIDFDKQRTYVYSEIAYPPFVAVLTINSPNPDSRLLDISWFRHHRFDQRVDVNLRLFSLPIVSYLPGDYRPEDEIVKT
jgi:hypothetical protein